MYIRKNSVNGVVYNDRQEIFKSLINGLKHDYLTK